MEKFEEMNVNIIARTLHFSVIFLTRTKFRYSGYESNTRTIAFDDEGNHEFC